jgi:hypothetical protein
MTTNKTYYIEPRENGYAVVAENAEKASALTRTQAQAIAKARQLTAISHRGRFLRGVSGLSGPGE